MARGGESERAPSQVPDKTRNSIRPLYPILTRFRAILWEILGNFWGSARLDAGLFESRPALTRGVTCHTSKQNSPG
jgi:hypothetical protein